MPDARLFYLGRHPQELPPGWRLLEGDPDRAIEVVPGVRVALISHGDYVLPDGASRSGAAIAVWDDREPAATVEWGIADQLSGYEKVRNCGDGSSEDGEKLARLLLPDHQRAYGEGAARLVTREIGPWMKVADA